ncbi:MAG TPA: hypothetical protein VF039_07145 [Longimicrobiales bacterium]
MSKIETTRDDVARGSSSSETAAAGKRAAPGDPPALLFDGLIAGFIGYAVVGVTLAAWSWSRGHSPLHDADLLGAALFFDGAAASPGAIDPAHVLAYNGAHLLVFAAFGIFMAWLAEQAERIPNGWYLFGIGFLFVMVHVAAVPLWFDETVQAEIPLAIVALATTLALLAMSLWLLREHPALRTEAHEPEGDGA